MSEDLGVRSFAVLQHLGGADGAHFDFLFDTSDASPLITFRIPEWPLAAGSTQAALKLRDHRRIYLTYEGQISGDRGHVSRVDEGNVRVTRAGTSWLLSHGDGRPFLLLEPATDDEWRITRSE
jgi:hypothetical protein